MNTETGPENFKGKYSHEAGEQEEGDRVMEELKRMFANISVKSEIPNLTRT